MESVIIAIRVLPNASKTQCEERSDDGTYKIRLQAQPEKGKANKALVRFLAKQLGVSRCRIDWIAGETSRHKRLRIHGRTDDEIEARLLDK